MLCTLAGEEGAEKPPRGLYEDSAHGQTLTKDVGAKGSLGGDSPTAGHDKAAGLRACLQLGPCFAP